MGAACVKPNTYSQIYIQIVFADKFNWQEGFGAFSYSRSHIDAVIKYIIRQEAHHRKKTFKEEYLDFLKKYEIKYDEKYLFDWIE